MELEENILASLRYIFAYLQILNIYSTVYMILDSISFFFQAGLQLLERKNANPHNSPKTICLFMVQWEKRV